MRLINIVDSVAPLNYGIWHAAVVNADLLKQLGHKVELWFPATTLDPVVGVELVQLSDLTISTLKDMVATRRLDPATDIIISHGVWQFPTRWAHYLKKLGFKWIYVPQGMLEPWPLKQKRIKKKLYFLFFEKRMSVKADLIRAVSTPEAKRLSRMFANSRVKFIPNGVDVKANSMTFLHTGSEKISYLFLSRLHHKKNVVALVEAWLESNLNNISAFELLIVGPDQGELGRITPLIGLSNNIKYLGTVFGNEKNKIISKCSFYILPSFSEGLPSALLESMGQGLIPIITEGCNLPEAFTENLGIKIDTSKGSIINGLNSSSEIDRQEMALLRQKNINFITRQFSTTAITNLQLKYFL